MLVFEGTVFVFPYPDEVMFAYLFFRLVVIPGLLVSFGLLPALAESDIFLPPSVFLFNFGSRSFNGRLVRLGSLTRDVLFVGCTLESTGLVFASLLGFGLFAFGLHGFGFGFGFGY